MIELQFTEPNARNTDPQTSHDAAKDARLKAGASRLQAMLHLADGAMTDHELAAATGYQHNSIGKRRGELRDAGLVEARVGEDGKTITRPAPSGSKATVWFVTEKGHRWLADAIRF